MSFRLDPRSGLYLPEKPAVGRRSFLGLAAAVASVRCASSEDAALPAADAEDRNTLASDAGSDGPGASTDGGADGSEGGGVVPASARFRFAVVADTHVVDAWYTGPENSPLDTASMAYTNERYSAVVDRIRALRTPVDFVVHLGDLIHDYVDADLDFMWANVTRMDTAVALTRRLEVPVHFCFGNHDYEFATTSREATHAYFMEKAGFAPYSAFDHRGWKFIMLNCYLGRTHDPVDPIGADGNGSLGEEQLLWLEAELAEGKPTFVFVHQMLPIIERVEVADLGLHGLLARYRDQIRYVLAGHTHRWMDLGSTEGFPHRVIGATRYDEDCFVIVEVDTARAAHRFLNESTWVNLSVESERWEEDQPS